MLSISPWASLGLERKAMLCFKNTYGALYKALNAVPPCSTAWLLARLDEPDPFVDASGDLGENGSGIGVLQFRRLRACVAGSSAKVGECRRKRIDVAGPLGSRKPIPVERRPPGDCMRRSLGLATKLHDALGYQVCVLLRPWATLSNSSRRAMKWGPLTFQ